MSNTRARASRISSLGAELWQQMHCQTPGVFDKGYWQGRLLDWAMQDPAFRIDMLRFVDVLPTLTETAQVSQHVREYLLRPGREIPTCASAT